MEWRIKERHENNKSVQSNVSGGHDMRIRRIFKSYGAPHVTSGDRRTNFRTVSAGCGSTTTDTGAIFT